MKNITKTVIVVSTLVALTACGGGGGGTVADTGSDTSGTTGTNGGSTSGAAGNNGGNTSTPVGKDAIIHNVSNTAEFRKALKDAESNDKDDKIILAAGTYKTTDDNIGTFTFSNKDHTLVISGAGRDSVILDGDDTDKILDITNTFTSSCDCNDKRKVNSTIIENLTLSHGRARLIDEENRKGQRPNIVTALNINAAGGVLKNVTIKDNYGGDAIVASDSSTVMMDVLFKNNENTAFTLLSGHVAMSNVTFEKNKAFELIHQGNDLVADGLNMTDNLVGMLIGRWGAGHPKITMSNSKFEDNKVGVILFSGGYYTINHSIIIKNSFKNSKYSKLYDLYTNLEPDENWDFNIAYKSTMSNTLITQNDGLAIGDNLHIEDSNITNNVSHLGSGFLPNGSTMLNCIVSDNIGKLDNFKTDPVWHRKAGTFTYMANNYFYNNTLKNIEVMVTAKISLNNTFYKNKMSYDDTYHNDKKNNPSRYGKYDGVSLSASYVWNTIISNIGTNYDIVVKRANDTSSIYNSYFNLSKIADYQGQDAILNNNLDSTSIALELNTNGTLSTGSPLINNGLDLRYVENDEADIIKFSKEVWEGKDLYGHTRVKDGVIDIGAVEK